MLGGENLLVEIFENERYMVFNGWSPKNLLRHARFTDAEGRAVKGLTELGSWKPPLGYEWVSDSGWSVDRDYTNCDAEGWSYEMGLSKLRDNAKKGTSLAKPTNALHNSRCRRWVRTARSIAISGYLLVHARSFPGSQQWSAQSDPQLFGCILENDAFSLHRLSPSRVRHAAECA